MRSGQSHAFVNLMVAAGANETRECEVLAFGPGVLVMRGARSAFVGVDRLQIGDRSVAARQFWIGRDGLYLVGTSGFRWDALAMTAEPPIDVAWSFDQDGGMLCADKPAKLSFTLPLGFSVEVDGRAYESTELDKPISIGLSAGAHPASIPGAADGVSAFLALMIETACETAKRRSKRVAEERPTHLNAEEVWRMALPASVTALHTTDLNGDGGDEAIIGCQDGTMCVIGVDGRAAWSHKFAAKVNDVCAADLDGDGVQEVIAGVEDEHAYAVRTGGTLLWSHRFEPYRHYPAHVRVVHAADFDRDGTPEVAVGCANSYFFVLDNQGKLRVDKDGPRWEMKTYHQASAIGSADVDGDKHLELLCGCTYFARYIVSFHKRRWLRTNALGGCISGCGSIATADVDADGHAEAIFADKDGRIAAAEKGEPYKAKVLWERFVGDDDITRILSDDLDRDGRPDLLAASRSGFLARLSATDGKIAWLQYGRSDMTDAAAADLIGDARREVVACNLDGYVYIYDSAGKLVARRFLGGPVTKLGIMCCKEGARPLVVGATGKELVAIRCR